MPLEIIILAAGLGRRMHSSLPKVLHALAGKPMIQHVVDTARALNPDVIHVVLGHDREKIQEALSGQNLHWVVQEEQLGTGHAVRQVLPHLNSDAGVLILCADVPLIEANTLTACVLASRDGLNLVTAKRSNPYGLGRILRGSSGEIIGIVEEKDASSDERLIQEVYSGIAYARAFDLGRWLPELSANNAQKEYYLTEMIAFAAQENLPIQAIAADPVEIQGVNDRSQLQDLERIIQYRQAQKLMWAGVGIADAKRIDIRGSLEAASDVFIDVSVVFEGKVRIGAGTQIGPHCYLKNVSLGKNCRVYAHSVLESCEIDDDSEIGPFARIRPGTVLAKKCKIGNFVEIKNTVMGQESKVNHLSYIGDTQMGEQVNVGAGTITCNYDGVNKHQTTIGSGAFIGSGTQLVAPIEIGADATIGAGSTIRKSVPPALLTLTVSHQKTIEGWARPKKRSQPIEDLEKL